MNSIIDIYISGHAQTTSLPPSCPEACVASLTQVNMAALEFSNHPKPQCSGDESDKDLFLSDEVWEIVRAAGDLDFVIVGSSFCCIGFVYRVLQNNPTAKILILECGEYVTFKDLTPLGLGEKEKSTEKFPWKFSTPENGHIEGVRGVNYSFGGRSHFWKAWCPQPTKEEMAEWPIETIERVREYFPGAKTLLSVRPVDEIFQQLQGILYKEMESTPSKIAAITKVRHAPIAIVKEENRYY
jgi:hypothetical protein